MMKTDKRKPSQ